MRKNAGSAPQATWRLGSATAFTAAGYFFIKLFSKKCYGSQNILTFRDLSVRERRIKVLFEHLCVRLQVGQFAASQFQVVVEVAVQKGLQLLRLLIAPQPRHFELCFLTV